MKVLKCVMVAVVLTLVVAPLASAQSGFQQVIEIKVEAGQGETFEKFAKAMVEAANKVSSPVTWNMFQVAVGKSSPTYRVVIPFEKWGDRDGWPQDVLGKAYGEEKAAEIWRWYAASVENVTARIWEQLEDGSSNVQPDAGVAKFYSVHIREVKRGQQNEYRSLQRKWKAAYEAEGKPSVIRSVQVFGEAPNVTFRRAQAFNKWSEWDAQSNENIMRKHHGEAEWLTIRDTMRDILVREQRFVSAHRPDLSRPQSASTTN